MTTRLPEWLTHSTAERVDLAARTRGDGVVHGYLNHTPGKQYEGVIVHSYNPRTGLKPIVAVHVRAGSPELIEAELRAYAMRKLMDGEYLPPQTPRFELLALLDPPQADAP